MKHLAVLTLAATFINLPAYAAEKSDCVMEKHMAGHAHSMIQGGATLKQTLQVLADTEPKREIISRIFDNRELLDSNIAAGEMGSRICKQLSASL